jgi:hypothetical protein
MKKEVKGPGIDRHQTMKTGFREDVSYSPTAKEGHARI